MSLPIPLNRRILRLLAFVLFFFSVFLYFLYVWTRPPLALYNQLFDTETELSKKLIHNERGNRYVKFRQLQGAGFNNQVFAYLYPFLLYGCSSGYLGSRNIAVSSSRAANISNLCIPTHDMAP